MEQLKKYAAQLSIHLTDDQLILFEKYYKNVKSIGVTTLTEEQKNYVSSFLSRINLLGCLWRQASEPLFADDIAFDINSAPVCDVAGFPRDAHAAFRQFAPGSLVWY